MAIDIKDVKLEANKLDVNFDDMKLSEAEKKKLQKKKLLIIGTTALTVGAAVVSKLFKLNRKVKKRNK